MHRRPALSTGGSKRGFLIPIGGAEEKEANPVILRRFVQICGGSHANIVVIPTASRLPDTGSRYVELFDDFGAESVSYMQLRERADCARPSNLKRLEEATGIFITGGNQLRLSTVIGGTKMADLIRHLNALWVRRERSWRSTFLVVVKLVSLRMTISVMPTKGSRLGLRAFQIFRSRSMAWPNTT